MSITISRAIEIATLSHDAFNTYLNQYVKSHESISFAELSPMEKNKNMQIVIDIATGTTKITPAIFHSQWIAKYSKVGWVYGSKFSQDKKMHPNFKSYNELSLELKMAYKLKFGIIKSLI